MRSHPTLNAQALFSAAEDFLTQYYHAIHRPDELPKRLERVRQIIEETGTYTHTEEELTYGARVAWRNSNRCIGRIYWASLKVRDCRHIYRPEDAFASLEEHLDFAFNGGKIRNTISIFAPLSPTNDPPLLILNDQLIRYAGYTQADGTIVGDPSQVEFTNLCQRLGWEGTGTHFDVLPVVFQLPDGSHQFFEWPSVEEVVIRHPEYDWFESLNLKWHSLPVISSMTLEIGGILYPMSPFNGWYMVTEVGSRNFGDADRYNLLPTVAEHMGLDINRTDNLWKDRALTELNTAVLYSYKADGVSMLDHHTAAELFLQFERSEERRGRPVEADWTWIVPPTAGSTMDVYHREYSNVVKSPNYFYRTHPSAEAPSKKESRCPFHMAHREREIEQSVSND